MSKNPIPGQGKIRDVYNENMVDELRVISELIEEYNYIAMVGLNINI